jgi:hypothetical protein
MKTPASQAAHQAVIDTVPATFLCGVISGRGAQA